MTEIENFNTGIKKEGSNEVINLNPKINIANKKKIRILLKNIWKMNVELNKKNSFYMFCIAYTMFSFT